MLSKEKILSDKYSTQLKELKAKEEIFENRRKEENKLFKEKLLKAVADERGGIKKELYEEFKNQIKSAEDEIQQKKSQLQSMREKELELLKREAKVKEEKETLQIKLEKDLLIKQKKIEDKAQTQRKRSTRA